MKHGKAAGYDNLSIEHLTFCHPISVHHLPRLLNLCLNHSYVPNGFRRGIVIPLVYCRINNVIWLARRIIEG